jgi:hypothetical protein
MERRGLREARMKFLSLLSVAATAALLPLAGHADSDATISVAEAQAMGQTCKTVYSPADRDGVIVCGTAEQWGELDARIAEINADYQRRREGMYAAAQMGAEMQRAAAATGHAQMMQQQTMASFEAAHAQAMQTIAPQAQAMPPPVQ